MTPRASPTEAQKSDAPARDNDTHKVPEGANWRLLPKLASEPLSAAAPM
jgi:hypothetical protein